MGKMDAKMVLGFVSTLLKGCVLTKGEDIVIDAEVLKKAEAMFDLGIKDEGTRFRITVKPAKPKSAPSISLPDKPKLWTPGQ